MYYTLGLNSRDISVLYTVVHHPYSSLMYNVHTYMHFVYKNVTNKAFKMVAISKF